MAKTRQMKKTGASLCDPHPFTGGLFVSTILSVVACLAFGTPASGAKPLMDGRQVTSVLQMLLQQCLKSCLG